VTAGAAEPLDEGDRLDAGAFVVDASGQTVNLRQRMARSQAGLSVLYLLGGGDMGAHKAGRLWCADSMQDAYILRSLYAKYAQRGVDFIVIAVPPLHHPDGAFPVSAQPLSRAARDSDAHQRAWRTFVDSTLDAERVGTLPAPALFDAENMLLGHPDAARAPASDRGVLPDWWGSLRDPWDEQVYGVPALWLFDRQGRVVSPPFRGNRYFNGGDIRLAYTLADVDAAIANALTQAH
jgi:hypothetical protein